jgi:hypothetical protein
MPAAKWFDEIILSDYTPANLEAQKKWLNKDKEAADWVQFFKHYSKLDGNEYVDHVVTFIYLFIYFMVSGLASGAVDRVFANPNRVKSKTIQLVLFASPLSTQQ